jgi:hypothetical protein
MEVKILCVLHRFTLVFLFVEIITAGITSLGFACGFQFTSQQ